MKKDVTKNEGSKLPEHLKDWKPEEGETVALRKEDVAMPVLSMVQPTSEMAIDGNARPGEILNITEGKVICEVGKVLYFYPFLFQRAWTVFKNVEKDMPDWGGIEYIKRVEDENAPLEFTDEDGVKCERKYCMVFYSFIGREKGLVESIPYLLTLRSSGLTFGRYLSTEMYLRNKSANLPPYAMGMEVFTELKKSTKGSYYVYKVKDKFYTPENVYKLCKKWLKALV